ncbi:hypothetical protein [Streptomyces bluensis]|uniref:hypothetical protein n=1 Tax=Streptomyces bluensis TaxID=33897 RepID=UPI00167B876F|nr:hypothetical protein [Streptomyces bluensis]GGZ74543.1 hypothetical protein GCM10010344_46950 [Streptomyces bluensis]
MGSVGLTFCSGAAVAVAATLTPGAACPVAYAADGGISVTPSPAAPGSDIQVRARGCSGRTGTASSEAFVADAVLTEAAVTEAAVTGRGGVLVGETRVRSSLRPGTYRVEVPCDGVEDKIEAMLTVAGKAGARGPSAAATTPAPLTTPVPLTTPAPASPQATASGVGGGETAHVVAKGNVAKENVAKENRELNPRDEGPGARHAVVGLVLASVAALVVVRRGARRGRSTE